MMATIALPNMNVIRHISFVPQNTLWVMGKCFLKKMDISGKVINSIDDKYKLMSAGGGHSVSEEGDLLFIARDRNSVKTTLAGKREGYGIFKMTSDGDTTTFLAADSAAEPRCIHYSAKDGSVLVGVTSGSCRSESRVLQFCDDGLMEREIEFDNENRRLYKRPDYITENKNGDIVVSDREKSAIVVVDESGQHRFDYRGQLTDGQFYPLDVCTDLIGRILVIHTDIIFDDEDYYDDDDDDDDDYAYNYCDARFYCSLLDKDGSFITRLLTGSDEDFFKSLCVDEKNNIYITYKDKIKVFK